MRPLFAGLSTETMHTYGLVLSASGIAYHASRHGTMWSIAVATDQRGAAIESVSSYLKENPGQTTSERSLRRMGVRTYSGGYVAAVLVLIHLLVNAGHDEGLFVNHLGADAARILDGEFYRCITALLLHADINHLMGNVAGLILFGTVAASYFGWGLGWLLILVTGFVGNLSTALWYQHDHLSIGASTAIFGAVGICSAINLRPGSRSPGGNSRRRWLPLAAGLALLGFLGTAPHSDLMAHLSGFVSGLVIGSAVAWPAERLPCRSAVWVQWVAAVLASSAVAAGWILGMFYSG